MGNELTPLTTDEVRHVLRRTGFGAPPNELSKLLGAVGGNPTRGSVADVLLSFQEKGFRPNGNEFEKAHNKWINYLIKPKSALQEKLAIFFHDHFATSSSVVGNVRLMGGQINTLHLYARGNFKNLVKAINKDAAMMEMLDTVRNVKAVPNENYGRELLELFTLGVYDLAGNPNYLQEDIVQIARAFTGWDYFSNKGIPYLRDYEHDFMVEFPERGDKVIFQSTGGFGSGGMDITADGEGENEIDTVIDIIFEHTDTDGKNTVARRLAARLLEYFCHGGFGEPGPAEIAVIDQVIDESNFDTSWNLTPLLRAIFVNDAFFETAGVAPYSASTKKSVKWPIDYFISTIRLTGIRLQKSERRVAGGNYLGAVGHLTNMGQILLEPPSVFGWNWETAWISSATLLARFNFARDIVAARSVFNPAKLVDLDATDPGEIVDLVTDVLGIVDQVTPAEHQIFVDYLTDDGANPTIDLRDYEIRNTKLHGLFALVMQSPAYQLH
ncbi:MAG: DUF1800 domain-containing protein [Deltaproteobacteria bacterium]|nr:DUF1800 domain-containing protein [Deltaproteobacteria bacterium]